MAPRKPRASELAANLSYEEELRRYHASRDIRPTEVIEIDPEAAVRLALAADAALGPALAKPCPRAALVPTVPVAPVSLDEAYAKAADENLVHGPRNDPQGVTDKGDKP